jgi:hydroxyacylglutathione hydrolase
VCGAHLETRFAMLSITPIPAFSDNYIWLLRPRAGTAAAVVDPGNETPVLAALEESGLELTAILVTHHHYDHIGGVEDLVAAYPDVRVFAPKDPRIRAVTDPVGEGEVIRVPGTDAAFRVLEVPGHTSSHIAYLGERALFCGDTLFAAGCGRVFDGTFVQLAASLGRIATLPADTLVYCAHEYTLDNLGFAGWVEPDSPALAHRIARVQGLRQAGRPSVPSRLSEELANNPFLRCGVPEVRAAAEGYAGRPLTSDTEVFTALRRWKDERYD